jgi:cephalosporin hydroxylase
MRATTQNRIRALVPDRAHARLRRLVIDQFAMLYYGRSSSTWQNTYWLGTRILKAPTDLWVYQEILHELRPDLIIETGTRFGGSARYLASVCDLLDHGHVVTVDIERRDDLPEHPRVEYMTASSVDPVLIADLTARAHSASRVLVILDSDHSRQHVLDELNSYAPLVTPGSYMIVEDTNVNGHPVSRRHGPGPMEAVDEFLATDGRFEIDASREKFLLTFNPRGYLRRLGETRSPFAGGA